MSIYTENGYKDRVDYLHFLAFDFEVDIEVVITLSSLLGSGEDFDALVTSLEDFAEGI